MSSIRHRSDSALPFLPYREPAPARRGGDGLLASVVGRARGALCRMAGGARVTTAEREVPMTAFGDFDAAIARARVVADRRGAVEAVACCCPDCLAPVGYAKFCPECGLALVPARSCRMCEAELPGGARFCLECGTPG
jgi:hypothetical protein